MIKTTNIQRFSLHDGPGIRTTVFLYGCNANCPWCCNPENLFTADVSKIELKEWCTDDLYNEIIKDKPFFEENGGITFSGGEPLLQINELKELLMKLSKDKINICFETSLFCPLDNLKTALNYASRLYVDIKSFDEHIYKNTIHANFEQYKTNLNYALESNVPIILRYPLIPGYTNNQDNISSITSLLEKSNLDNVQNIEILQGHNLGKEKFQKAFGELNKFYKTPISQLEEREVSQIVELFKKATNNKIKIEYLKI